MKLSPHFTLAEFTRSDTATARRISNNPTDAHIDALKLLCVHVLEPVRAHFGKPVRINSGFRSAALNRSVGGSASSQHMKGEAADIEIAGVSNYDLARYIRDNLDFDQVILEFYTPGQSSSGWVHVSWRPEKRRKQSLTAARRAGRTVYLSGLVK